MSQYLPENSFGQICSLINLVGVNWTAIKYTKNLSIDKTYWTGDDYTEDGFWIRFVLILIIFKLI